MRPLVIVNMTWTINDTSDVLSRLYCGLRSDREKILVKIGAGSRIELRANSDVEYSEGSVVALEEVEG